MEELLLKITQQEKTHLKHEKAKVEGTMTDYVFRQRKLQKKLDACNDALGALKQEESTIDQKIETLNGSLSIWEEAASELREEGTDKSVKLIEILCEKNPLSPVSADSDPMFFENSK